ncbi:ATP-binding cassette domain-containing protein [Fodinibacter luteus]|uniref:ATP-binding cassette domain-containing protein n=1 Tax=Fodinibacter luteus TaxID=552064 RepID=UPI0031E88943
MVSARGRVEVEGLTWRPYGRRDPVLRDVTLTLRAGERVLLVGPSGSGKSTLLRALAGLLETVDAGDLAGSVAVDGASPGSRPGAVGLVLQEPGSGVVAASVGRDVAFGPENVGMPRAAVAGVVASALAAVGLGDVRLDTPTSALSGGQTQRLALAGALALDPSVVLLDEPTAMLDPASAGEVRDAVAALGSPDGWPDGCPTRRPPTVVVVEHVLGPWVDLVERLVVLSDDGRVVADGPVRETLAAERERLLGMGIWVPGADPPSPVPVDPELVAPRHAHGTPSPRLDTAAPRLSTVEGHASSPRLDTAADRLSTVEGRDSAAAERSGVGGSGSAAAAEGSTVEGRDSAAAEGSSVGGSDSAAPERSSVESADSTVVSASPFATVLSASPFATVLSASPFAVERTTRLVDGRRRTRRAAELADPLVATPGSLTALVGPSGSGKSTILHALAGFLTPTDEHAVAVRAPRAAPHAEGVPLPTDPDGGPAPTPLIAAPDAPAGQRRGSVAPGSLSAPDLARTLAWVPQWSSSTIVAPTVLDEVLATAHALGEDGPATTDRGRALLSALGLGHLEAADPRELSGGEQRRLAVAAALHHGPPVLLADEPTVGQDRRTWAALVGLVAAYRRAGGAVVAATHDVAVVDRATTVHRLAAPAAPPEVPVTGIPLVARCGPLALLVGALLAIPAGVLSPHWSTSLAVLATQLVLAVVGLWAPGGTRAARDRAGRVGLRVVPGLVAALSVGWSTWFLAGHDLDAALTVALRVLVIVVPSAVLVPWIDPDALGDHLAQRLRLPDRPVVATAAALQRVHSFGAIWSELSRARRVRGLGVSWRRPRTLVAHLGALTMGLLVRTLRAAADLAVAMDARGFATAQSRSWWMPAPWLRRDTALVLLASLPLVVAVLAR